MLHIYFRCDHVLCGPCKCFAIIERGLPPNGACPRCPDPPLASPIDAAARVLATAAANERALEASVLHRRKTTSSIRPATTGTWDQGRQSLPLSEKEDPRPLSQRSRQRRHEAAEEAARRAAAHAAAKTAERAHRRATFLFLPVWRRVALESTRQDRGTTSSNKEENASNPYASTTPLNWAELPPVLAKDLAAAQSLLKEAAELGNVHAQYALR